MVDSLDFGAVEAAGIADAAARAGLLEYLAGLGFTVEEMAAAERRGRLFGLAGDALLQSGPQTFTLRGAAASIGVPVTDVEYAWSMLGLTAHDADTPMLSRADVDALGTWVAMRERLGRDGADGYLRVLGASVARLAEAVSSLIRSATPELWLGHSGDELSTAQAYHGVAGFVPRVGAMIDSIHRHHLVSTRTFIEGMVRSPSAGLMCGIGFADLSGFTALTQALAPAALSALLDEFGAAASDAVHAEGGRVVKFLGDAVMWVNSDPARLAEAALRLVDHPRARDAGLQVRAGLAYGEVLAMVGDYFGNAVNLAARLVAAADPGRILISDALYQQLPNWPVAAQEPLQLKGFAEPVAAYELVRAAG